MKLYIKPELVYVQLSSEEKFAVGSICKGSCPNNEVACDYYMNGVIH